MRAALAILVAALFAVPAPALAQAPAPSPVPAPATAPDPGPTPAEAAFRRGRELAVGGDCIGAEAAFLESIRIEPSVGALLNLGNCDDRLGKTASAWTHFREAATLAARLGDERRAVAEQYARAVEPRLSYLTVRVEAPGDEPVTLTCDGVALPTEAWGTARVLDPGDHVVEALGPGVRPVTRVVHLGRDGDRQVLVLPLERVAVAPATVPIAPAPAPPAERAPLGGAETAPASGPGAVRTTGWIVGAAGLAALAVGAGFGAAAVAKHGDLVRLCPTYPVCDEGARNAVTETNDAAHRSAVISTVAFAVGAAATAAGALILLTVGRNPAPAATPKGGAAVRFAPTVSPLGAGLIAGGRF